MIAVKNEKIQTIKELANIAKSLKQVIPSMKLRYGDRYAEIRIIFDLNDKEIFERLFKGIFDEDMVFDTSITGNGVCEYYYNFRKAS